MKAARSVSLATCLLCLLDCESKTIAESTPADSVTMKIRIATYNVSLSENADLPLAEKLHRGEKKAENAAAVIQHVRPDILVLNEFDFDEVQLALEQFQARYLGVSQAGEAPIRYDHVYAGPVNTGEPSGLDLDQDGTLGEPEDAYGFGRYPGQYGMALLSRFPLERGLIRTFQTFLWTDMPGAQLPKAHDGASASKQAYYPSTVEAQIRLSSKSHWDIPIRIGSSTLHALLAHPTPPAFDGPEDRNGHRNHDEIRLLHDYLAGHEYMVDDNGVRGGLTPDVLFFTAGDFNADPSDGASRDHAISRLLDSPLINPYPAPASAGGPLAAAQQAGANLGQQGNPANDTADFSDARVGNLRVDYVLPSVRLPVTASGVFWPVPGERGHGWIGTTDHRLVWVDIKLPDTSAKQP